MTLVTLDPFIRSKWFLGHVNFTCKCVNNNKEGFLTQIRSCPVGGDLQHRDCWVWVPALQTTGIWGRVTLLVSVVSHPAPEHFGDTILFTTDEDILEAIFCSDETFDVDPESPYSLQSEETPRRPSTAGSEGEDRPYTQAGPWAEDRVGLVGRGAPPERFLPLTPRAAGGMKMDSL